MRYTRNSPIPISHPQVGHGEQSGQLSGVLHHSTIAYLQITELALDHPKRDLPGTFGTQRERKS